MTPFSDIDQNRSNEPSLHDDQQPETSFAFAQKSSNLLFLPDEEDSQTVTFGQDLKAATRKRLAKVIYERHTQDMKRFDRPPNPLNDRPLSRFALQSAVACHAKSAPQICLVVETDGIEPTT